MKALHTNKFDKGRRSPQEFHQQYAFPQNARCCACPNRPNIRAIVLCPFDEAQKRGMLPEGAMFNPAVMQTLVTIKEGNEPKPYLRLSVTYSCKSCQKEFEKALAKAPSWCIVELNHGPDPKNKVSIGA